MAATTLVDALSLPSALDRPASASRAEGALAPTEDQPSNTAESEVFVSDQPASHDAAGSEPPPLRATSTPEASLLSAGIAALRIDLALEALTLPAESSPAPVALPGSLASSAHAVGSLLEPSAPEPSVSSTNGADGRALLARSAENAPLRLIDRGLHALVQQRGGTLIMRLSPPELGMLEIRMSFGVGRVEITFRAGAEASRLLDGNLGMLRQSLERHGIGVGRLAIEPTEFRRAEESARAELGGSFDASGRESQGRQEAERALRWRTDIGLALAQPPRPASSERRAAEGSPACPPSHPLRPAAASSPAATES